MLAAAIAQYNAQTPIPVVVEPVEKVAYNFDGVAYLLDADAVDDLEVLELLENEKLMTALRRIMGDKQWERFKESQRDPDTGRVSPDKFEAFLDGLFARLGESAKKA